MNVFYSPEINSETPFVFLSEEESVHAVRVLRMKRGDTIFLTNGKGMFFEGEIAIPNPKKCEVKVTRSIQPQNLTSYRLTVAMAPTKNINRFEWFLEKATEIGCSEIIPIRCKHSERHEIKATRLSKVMISAMKQCLKAELPVLRDMIGFETFCLSFQKKAQEEKECQRFICHIPESDERQFPPQNPKGNPLAHTIKRIAGSHIVIAIGPEGGFSEEEVAFAVQKGFSEVSMGNSRLRVETAGVTACAIVSSVFQ